jgi:hypothetical protein
MDEIFKRLSKDHLEPGKRIDLKMIVMDSDKKAAVDFLSGFGLELDAEEAFSICREWLKSIERGEQGKLNIRLTGRGLRID